jgi:hypothetical protein
LHSVNVLGDRNDIRVGQRLRRHGGHAWRLPPLLDYRNDQLPMQIGERQLRAEQVGAAGLAAAKVGAMARPAVDLIEQLAAIARGLVGELPLLRREPSPRASAGGASTRAPTALPPGHGGCASRTRRCGRRVLRAQMPRDAADEERGGARNADRQSHVCCALLTRRQFTLAP